ncbi:hypothetical protein M5K25_004827 [Dendrobium thyrsiflorum]|uniref:Uncharacterized protein n=1 Tax=Dendrobium thyrsiflorum TaxID=117978 RepID=A0ABD0VGC0_DENTH
MALWWLLEGDLQHQTYVLCLLQEEEKGFQGSLPALGGSKRIPDSLPSVGGDPHMNERIFVVATIQFQRMVTSESLTSLEALAVDFRWSYRCRRDGFGGWRFMVDHGIVLLVEELKEIGGQRSRYREWVGETAIWSSKGRKRLRSVWMQADGEEGGVGSGFGVKKLVTGGRKVEKELRFSERT